MTPNIIQTMKQTVNASVLTTSTDHAWRGMAARDGGGVGKGSHDADSTGVGETVRPAYVRDHPTGG
jgi:hypothetical protein